MSAKWAKRSSGPAGDECHNLVLADPISASEGRTYSNEGKQRKVRLHNVVSFKPSHYTREKDGAPHELAPPLSADADRGDQDPLVFANGSDPVAFRKAQKAHGPEDCERWELAEVTDTLDERDSRTANAIAAGSMVRRLTPLECERLQGFPDGWTCLCQPLAAYHGEEDVDAVSMRCSCADGPRYRTLGNAVTVSVVGWLGERLRQAFP